MKFKDYYQILQVDPNATLEEIKQAYHRLAHKYHPDISKEADAERQFKEIKLAYEVLKDPQKRASYATRFRIILPYSYEWLVSKRNTWLNYFAQQQAKQDARTRIKLQWQSWKSRPTTSVQPSIVQPSITNPVARNKNLPHLTPFSKQIGIAILLILFGILGYFGLKQVQTWHSYRQWQLAILQPDKVAIRRLEQADPKTQRQVLQDNSVKIALVTFYLQQNDVPILTRLATYDATIQADILKNDTVYQLLITYFNQQITTELTTDNFSTALQQLETLLKHYPASLELKNKYEAIGQQKQQRLAQLTQQYMECLDQTLAPLLERTHCMVEARRKIEQVGIEHHLPSDPNLSAMYTEEIQHALAESAYEKVEKLLLDWEKLLPEPDEKRQLLWKNLALHRQLNDITTDLSSPDPNKIVSRLSQLTTDENLQHKVTQLPKIQENLVNYHLSEALALLTYKQQVIQVDSKTLSKMKKIITALQEPPIVKPQLTPKTVTAATMITSPGVVSATSSPATAGKVDHLLQECQTHYQANRLTTGAPGTALACYQTVLQLVPNNRQALEGLNHIQNRYLSWIESALQQNNLNKANAYLTSLQRINPQLPALTRLKERLKPATLLSQKASASPPQKAPPSLNRVKKSTVSAPRVNQLSSSSSSQIDSPPLAVLKPSPKKNLSCEGCNCSGLLKQLSMGVKPLTSAQSSFFRNQCR